MSGGLLTWDAAMKGGVAPAPSAPSAPADASSGLISFDDAMKAAPPSPVAASGQPAAKTGMGANLAAGAVEGGSGYLNMLADPVGNLIGKPLAGLLTTAHDVIAPMFGGQKFSDADRAFMTGDTVPQLGTRATNALGNAMGAPTPDQVVPANGEQALGRAAVAGTVAGAPFGGVGALASGVGSVTGEVAANAVPPEYAPAAGVVGGLAGGAATGAAVGTAGTLVNNRFTRPITQAGRERNVGDQMWHAAEDPQAALDTLNQQTQTNPTTGVPNHQIVPGSTPDVYQVTNDQGLGSFVNAQRVANQAPFEAQAQANSRARTQLLSSQGDATADPQAVSGLFRTTLDQMTQADHVARTADQSSAAAAVDALPGNLPTTPGQSETALQTIGSRIRSDLDANSQATKQAAFARFNALADSQSDAATDPQAIGGYFDARLDHLTKDSRLAAERDRANAVSAVDALPGNLPTTPGQADTALQTLGSVLRQGLDAKSQATKSAASRLFDALDPDGTLKVNLNPIKATADKITAQRTPMADPLNANEAGIYQTAQDFSGVQPFSYVKQFRERVSNAIAQAKDEGDRAAAFRLGNMLNGIDETLGGTVAERAAQDDAAVRAGKMAPDTTMMARLQAEANVFQQSRRAQAGGNSGAGYRANPGGGSSGVSGFAGTEVPAGGRAGPSPGGQSLQGAPDPVTANFTPEKAAQYQQARAAWRDWAQRFADPDTAPGVAQVLRKGASGYKLQDSQVPGTLFKSGPGAAERITAYTNAGGDPQAVANAAAYSLRQATVEQDGANAGTLNPRKYQQWMAQHREAMNAFPELAQRFQSAATATESMAQAATARQAALESFQKSPAGQFFGGSDPVKALGSILARKTAAADLRELAKQVGGNSTARNALEAAAWEHIEQRLTNARGQGEETQIKAQAFKNFARDRAAALQPIIGQNGVRALRNLAADLDGTDAASGAPRLPIRKVANLTADQSVQYAAARQAWRNWNQKFVDAPGVGEALRSDGNGFRFSDSQVPGALFRPGADAAERITAYTNAGGSPGHIADAAAFSLRQAAIDGDGTLNPVRFNRWMAQHREAMNAFPELGQRFQSAADATTAMQEAAANRKAQIDGYQKSVAAPFLGNADPVQAFGSILGKKTAAADVRDLAQRVASNPDAKAGLEKAAWQHIMDRLTNAKGEGEDAQIKAQAFKNFARDKAAALTPIIGQGGVQIIRNLATDLERGNRQSIVKGQSATAHNLADSMKHGAHGQTTWQQLLIAEGFGNIAEAVHGHALASKLVAPATLVLNALRLSGVSKQAELANMAARNPELARALMQQASGRAATPQAKRIASLIVRSTAAQGTVAHRQQPKQADPTGGYGLATPPDAPRYVPPSRPSGPVTHL